MSTLAAYCTDVARRARAAARALAVAPAARKDAWLRAAADALVKRADELLAANEKDVAGAVAGGPDARRRWIDCG